MAKLDAAVLKHCTVDRAGLTFEAPCSPCAMCGESVHGSEGMETVQFAWSKLVRYCCAMLPCQFVA